MTARWYFYRWRISESSLVWLSHPLKHPRGWWLGLRSQSTSRDSRIFFTPFVFIKCTALWFLIIANVRHRHSDAHSCFKMTRCASLAVQMLIVTFVSFSVALTTTQRPTHITNITSPSILNFTAPFVACSSRYGRNLDIDSCAEAYRQIWRASSAPVTLGERGTGNWDVILPYRLLSGTSNLERPLKVSVRHQAGEVASRQPSLFTPPQVPLFFLPLAYYTLSASNRIGWQLLLVSK